MAGPLKGDIGVSSVKNRCHRYVRHLHMMTDMVIIPCIVNPLSCRKINGSALAKAWASASAVHGCAMPRAQDAQERPAHAPHLLPGRFRHPASGDTYTSMYDADEAT